MDAETSDQVLTRNLDEDNSIGSGHTSSSSTSGSSGVAKRSMNVDSEANEPPTTRQTLGALARCAHEGEEHEWDAEENNYEMGDAQSLNDTQNIE